MTVSQIVYSNMIIRPMIEKGLENSIGEEDQGSSAFIKPIAAELANRITTLQDKSATNPLPRFGGDQ